MKHQTQCNCLHGSRGLFRELVLTIQCLVSIKRWHILNKPATERVDYQLSVVRHDTKRRMSHSVRADIDFSFSHFFRNSLLNALYRNLFLKISKLQSCKLTKQGHLQEVFGFHSHCQHGPVTGCDLNSWKLIFWKTMISEIFKMKKKNE